MKQRNDCGYAAAYWLVQWVEVIGGQSRTIGRGVRRVVVLRRERYPDFIVVDRSDHLHQVYA